MFLQEKQQKPDKLAEYRDQRLNRPDGPGSYEPQVVRCVMDESAPKR